jgi:hypothetical protein
MPARLEAFVIQINKTKQSLLAVLLWGGCLVEELCNCLFQLLDAASHVIYL